MRLAAVARFLRQQDASSPAPYLLLRGYRWGEVRGYGESPDPTVLIPPSSEVRQNIKRLSLEANWGEVLEAAETAMAEPCGRAWLDLQRYVVRAAEEWGYYNISKAVISELRALLADVPSLPHLTLMDDTATANAETQAWIRDVVQAASGSAPAEVSAPSFDEPAVEESSAPASPRRPTRLRSPSKPHAPAAPRTRFRCCRKTSRASNPAARASSANCNWRRSA